ncbi:heavy-metal-associated domain-containing protein [Planomonospora parontospora]|uniref:heavy-metal-associated domain-containing protein n=1 Tax=Planomonospora parontospora TaxID=58119 RepID=UPI00166F97E3|nr:heavy metal-associated domain-containing protein [Planomonospora parontospora]GGL57395.1 hypothetical protein GCM10014719_68550 [Planomonospora parontospora subsp. antibiotica]GII19994.1 hypothetical protein Ppa05_67200 [Planomonospora parontospora subsp. antibiotica]
MRPHLISGTKNGPALLKPRTVTAALGALQGVSNVTADLPTGQVTVISASPLPVGQVAATVRKAGYELIPLRS